jgi:HlyD family secretion protein
MRRRSVITAVTLGIGGIAAAVAWTNLNNGGDPTDKSTAGTTATATVLRTTVADREPVAGSLGHTGTYKIVSTGQGTVSQLPAVLSTIKRGQRAYEVDGKKVPLLYGNRPQWRDFTSGMSDGADVHELETNLEAMGYGADMTVDRHFSSATAAAIDDWQNDMGWTETGELKLGQVVFAPSELRVSTLNLAVGQRVHPGQIVLEGTSNQRAVTVQLTPTTAPSVKVGDTATVTLPNGTNSNGTVTSIGAVATTPPTSSGSASQSTVPVTITIKGEIRGFLDSAQVQVLITADRHKNVLAVPTVALAALPNGKYEVVVVSGTTRTHIPVETGLFDETSGLAEVSGPGLSAGQQVEVPRDSS